MDQVSQFDPHELGKYAGDFRATYVEGGSGDEESAEEGIDNIAESVVKYFDAVVTDQYRHSVQAT
jgi:hypothetical protein